MAARSSLRHVPGVGRCRHGGADRRVRRGRADHPRDERSHRTKQYRHGRPDRRDLAVRRRRQRRLPDLRQARRIRSDTGGQSMSLGSFIRKQFIDILQWNEDRDGVLAWRHPMQDFEIQYGASLTVRESQMAVFVNEGKVADVFGPGICSSRPSSRT
ncbi:hypothetical protein G6F31_018971 [Rhizopus arrhizus]|nr:hypothetical protein G6F31_018971 [Rhizopus arrhizus]